LKLRLYKTQLKQIKFDICLIICTVSYSNSNHQSSSLALEVLRGIKGGASGLNKLLPGSLAEITYLSDSVDTTDGLSEIEVLMELLEDSEGLGAAVSEKDRELTGELR
jgi:hypothetical protein